MNTGYKNYREKFSFGEVYDYINNHPKKDYKNATITTLIKIGNEMFGSMIVVNFIIEDNRKVLMDTFFTSDEEEMNAAIEYADNAGVYWKTGSLSNKNMSIMKRKRFDATIETTFYPDEVALYDIAQNFKIRRHLTNCYTTTDTLLELERMSFELKKIFYL